MARKKKINVKAGDVFSITVDNKKKAFGQVVHQGSTSDCIIIFDITDTEIPSLQMITESPIVFLAYTIDNKLEDGDWEIIGNYNIPNDLSFPNNIIETLEGSIVIDINRNVLRKATKDDIANLKPPKSYSPAVIEHAVKAKFGDEEWYPYLDNLIYNLK
jgi:hypothetical protein